MKVKLSIILFISAFRFVAIHSQNFLPSVDIQTLEGTTYNTSKMGNYKKPVIIIFWESFCKSSNAELDIIAENFTDWVEETGVTVIAVSIDDVKTQSKVQPLVSSKGWEFEFFMDVNRDFKRAMSVNICPHTFLLDNNGNVVWQMIGYAAGQEIELYENIKKLAKGGSID